MEDNTTAWIELHQEFRDHPKVARLATRLNIEYCLAQAYLINLWLWACAYAQDGELTGFTPREIAEAAKTDADPGLFISSLVETRWVDKKDEKLSIHDWKKHGLRVLKDSQQRQAKSRKSKKLREELIPSLSRDGSVLLSIFSFFSIPSNHILRGKPFLDVWEEWLQFRAFEKSDPVTPIAAKKQFKFLLTQRDPVGVVEYAIAHQWRGLYPVRENGSGGSNQKQASTPYDQQVICPSCGTKHNETKCPSCGTPRKKPIHA